MLTVVAGVALLLVGVAGMTGQCPVSTLANAWLFEDKPSLRQALESGGADKRT